jgi:hypothetical protein
VEIPIQANSAYEYKQAIQNDVNPSETRIVVVLVDEYIRVADELMSFFEGPRIPNIIIDIQDI